MLGERVARDVVAEHVLLGGEQVLHGPLGDRGVGEGLEARRSPVAAAAEEAHLADGAVGMGLGGERERAVEDLHHLGAAGAGALERARLDERLERGGG